MKIVTFNVNGIRSAYRKGLENWMKNENPDILCLQEIKTQELITNAQYHVNFNPATKKGYSGVAVFSKLKPKTVTKSLNLKRFDNEGRILELEFEFDNFILINLYLPHGGRGKENLDYKLQVYDLLLEKLNKVKNKNIILTGDFNIAHKELDLARPTQNKDNIMFTPEERSRIDKITDLGFIDTFRLFNKTSGEYTWWSYAHNAREQNIGWRLDYIFISKSLKKKVKKVSILKKISLSDHCPYLIEISL